MNTHRVDFVWAYGEEYGVWGWLAKCAPDLDPCQDGRLVAHDVLEHFQLSRRIEDEAEAFGAILFVRLETGWFLSGPRLFRNPEEIVANDIAHFLRETWYDQDLHDTPLPEPRLEEHTEALIKDVSTRAMKSFQAEMDHGGDESVHWRDLGRIRKHLRSWLRRGYRRADERYSGRQDPASWLFTEVMDAVDALEPTGTNDESYAGREMYVEIDLDTLMCRVVEPELEDEYEDEEEFA